MRHEIGDTEKCRQCLCQLFQHVGCMHMTTLCIGSALPHLEEGCRFGLVYSANRHAVLQRDAMECKQCKLPLCVRYVLGATMHGLISRQLLEILGRPNPLEACSCPTTSHLEYGASSQVCKDTDTCCHRLKFAVPGPSALRDAC